MQPGPPLNTTKKAPRGGPIATSLLVRLPITIGLLTRVNHLQLCVFQQSFQAKLDTNTRHFTATERGVWQHFRVVVDPYSTALQLPGNRVCQIKIRTPNRAAQTELAGVGHCNSLLDIGIRDDGQNRSKLLFITQSRAIRNVGHNGQWVKIALARVRLTTKNNPASLQKKPWRSSKPSIKRTRSHDGKAITQRYYGAIGLQGLECERTAAGTRCVEQRKPLQSATDAGLSQPASTRPVSVLGEHHAPLAAQTKSAGRTTRSARTTIESDAAPTGHRAQSGLEVDCRRASTVSTCRCT